MVSTVTLGVNVSAWTFIPSFFSGFQRNDLRGGRKLKNIELNQMIIMCERVLIHIYIENEVCGISWGAPRPVPGMG